MGKITSFPTPCCRVGAVDQEFLYILEAGGRPGGGREAAGGQPGGGWGGPGWPGGGPGCPGAAGAGGPVMGISEPTSLGQL